MSTILLVDDDPAILEVLKMRLELENHRVIDVKTETQAIAAVETHAFELAIIDYQLGNGNGIQLMEQAKQIQPDLPVIILTAHGTIEKAVQAIQKGAYTYLTKPFDDEELIHHVRLGCEKNRLTEEIRSLKRMLYDKFGFDNIIAKDEKMIAVLKSVIQASKIDSNILLEGESGTGKELMAKSIHVASNRKDAPFIAINCAAIPETLFESELFGVKKGAFTGADHEKKGLFLEAHGSTILLDEVADIPVSIQTKLLRVLQEKEIQPLGQNKTIKVDVRVVASTNQNLEEKIKKGDFREDLFYRLNVVTVTMPNLLEMREDIPLLIHHFFSKFKKQYERQKLTVTPEIFQTLYQRSWKGNVRELQNSIKRIVLLTPGDSVEPSDVEELLENGCDTVAPGTVVGGFEEFYAMPYNEAKTEVVEKFSKEYLHNLLTSFSGNVTNAAASCGLERQGLQRIMRRYNILSADYKNS